METAVLLATGTSFALFLILHIFLLRLWVFQPAPRIIFLSLSIGFLFGPLFFFLVTPSFVIFPDSVPEILLLAFLSMFLYGLLVLQYIAWIFGMGEAAIRIRILLELQRRFSKGASLNEIYEHYNAEQILKVRLSRLVNAGHLTEAGDRYQLKKRILIIEAFVIRMLKLWMGISVGV